VGARVRLVPPYADPEEFDFEKLKAGDEEEWAKAREILRPIAFAEARRQLAKFSGKKRISLPQDGELVADEVMSGKWHKTKGHFSGGLKQGIENGKIQSSKELYGAAKGYAHDLAHELGKAAPLRDPEEEDTDEETSGKGSIGPTTTENPRSKAEEDEVKSLLSKCMAERLNEREFLIADAFYFKELKYREISEKHEIPMGTIGVCLQNAHQKLRKCMEKHGVTH